VKLVFIMGPHRSGTTILYKLLAATGLFNVTTVFHVVNRRELAAYRDATVERDARRALSALFAERGLTDREFDSIPVGPDMPEEYAYALEHQGRRPRLDDKNLPGFLTFCRDVQALQDPDRPLLLKNPFDADNFVYIRREIPNARFVFVHRRPAEVISSQIRAIRSILDERNEYVALVSRRYDRLSAHRLTLGAARALYADRWPLLVEQVAGNVTRVNEYFVNNRHVFAAGQAAGVTYDSLCVRPEAAIRCAVDAIGLPAPRRHDYAELIRARSPELLPEVRARLARISRDNAAYCEVVGFQASAAA
jgi:hypothetical protein